MTTDLGLPGQIADTHLILPPGLSEKKITDTLYLLGRIGRATPWWTADLLVYAEDHLPEGRFSQVAEASGLSPQTLQNLVWVGRAWPRSRRREEATFGHHAELAALEPTDQDHWLQQAIEGDLMPNGERHRWSVTTLRERLKGTPVVRVGPAEIIAAPPALTHCPCCGWDLSQTPAPGTDHAARWGTVEGLVALYNERAPDHVPAVETVSPKRREKARKLLKMCPERKWWEQVFEEYRRSKFLMGRVPPSNGHGRFRPDFDWLMANGKTGVENAVAVHDGAYAD